MRAVIEVKITPEREGGFNRLAERIAKYSEVSSCYLMSGGYDLLVIVEGSNLREVATFVSENSPRSRASYPRDAFHAEAAQRTRSPMKREPNDERPRSRLAITITNLKPRIHTRGRPSNFITDDGITRMRISFVVSTACDGLRTCLKTGKDPLALQLFHGLIHRGVELSHRLFGLITHIGNSERSAFDFSISSIN